VPRLRRKGQQVSESATTSLLDVEARDIRTGDDLFGAGVVTSAVFVGESVQVAAGGTTFTFWPDEEVTVRRV
jgi:hypothetical protein